MACLLNFKLHCTRKNCLLHLKYSAVKSYISWFSENDKNWWWTIQSIQLYSYDSGVPVPLLQFLWLSLFTFICIVCVARKRGSVSLYNVIYTYKREGASTHGYLRALVWVCNAFGLPLFGRLFTTPKCESDPHPTVYCRTRCLKYTVWYLGVLYQCNAMPTPPYALLTVRHAPVVVHNAYRSCATNSPKPDFLNNSPGSTGLVLLV